MQPNGRMQWRARPDTANRFPGILSISEAKAGPGDDAQWQSKTTAFAKLSTVLRVSAGGREEDELEDGSDLKFIAHLVGDIHQPLHTETDQDRGGEVLVCAPHPQW